MGGISVERPRRPSNASTVEDASEAWVGVVKYAVSTRVDPKLAVFLRTFVKRARVLSDSTELVRLPVGNRPLYHSEEDAYPLTTRGAVALVDQVGHNFRQFELNACSAIGDAYVAMAGFDVSSFNEVAVLIEQTSITHARAVRNRLVADTGALHEVKSYPMLIKLVELLRDCLADESGRITEGLRSFSQGRVAETSRA